jgi:hypothetical protein
MKISLFIESKKQDQPLSATFLANGHIIEGREEYQTIR